MITFGPVPSRRLGRSLGINNIPPKLCSYSCVYCQAGRTLDMEIERHDLYDPARILGEVVDRVRKVMRQGESIDYLSFVPDGEPTLDRNLGRSIDVLGPLGIKRAVITNASLIWRKDVRQELARADWVSLKVDSVLEAVWRKTNRSHRALELDAILEGMLEFREIFTGKLATETMLVRGVNDGDENLEAVAAFLSRLDPSEAYIALPTRPPAEKRVRPAEGVALTKAYQIFSKQVEHVEYLIGYEGDAFAHTGDMEQDLLSITAVHPMREDAVKRFLADSGGRWSDVRELLDDGRLLEADYEGQKFYIRRFRRRQRG